MNLFRHLISLLLLIFPWKIRRIFLITLYKYQIDPTAKIGFSIIIPDKLELGARTQIGHLNICKGLKLLKLEENSIINNLNWITGMQIGKNHFLHREDRNPCLILGPHAAITNRHIIDCTDTITIGQFTTIAGFGSQLLTHSIDLVESIQDCAPISIGSYCFVGTDNVILPGSSIGNYCILSAKSLLNKPYQKDKILYGGVPAVEIKEIKDNLKYFSRTSGFIN